MTKEIAIHNLFALKLRSRVSSDRDALGMAIKALEKEPKSGHWIENTYESSRELWDRTTECSECGYKLGGAMPNFCPNCGARMENSVR